MLSQKALWFNQAIDEYEKYHKQEMHKLAEELGIVAGKLMTLKSNLPSERDIEYIIMSRLDCPNCNNSGTIEVDSDEGWEQCEFCHREENSKFNLAKAISKRLRGEE